MAQARPLRHVALAFSNKLSHERGAHVQEHGDALKGFYDALTRGHVPFEMVRDDLLTDDGLRDYSTLVLPSLWAMSDEQVGAVRRFVDRGGALVSTFETSRYTPEGWDRYDFGLAEVLGVRYLSEHEAPWCYVVPNGSHPVLAHVGGQGIPHGDLRQLVRRHQDEWKSYRLTPVVAQIIAGEAARSGTHLKVEAGRLSPTSTRPAGPGGLTSSRTSCPPFRGTTRATPRWWSTGSGRARPSTSPASQTSCSIARGTSTTRGCW